MLKVISWYKIILNFGLVKAKWRVDFMNEMTFKPLPNQIHQSSFISLWEWEMKWKDWLNLKGFAAPAIIKRFSIFYLTAGEWIGEINWTISWKGIVRLMESMSEEREQRQSTSLFFWKKKSLLIVGRSSWRHQQIKLMKLIFFVGLACRFRHTAGQPIQFLNQFSWRWKRIDGNWLVTAPCLRKLHSILKIQL